MQWTQSCIIMRPANADLVVYLCHLHVCLCNESTTADMQVTKRATMVRPMTALKSSMSMEPPCLQQCVVYLQGLKFSMCPCPPFVTHLAWLRPFFSVFLSAAADDPTPSPPALPPLPAAFTLRCSHNTAHSGTIKNKQLKVQQAAKVTRQHQPAQKVNGPLKRYVLSES